MGAKLYQNSPKNAIQKKRAGSRLEAGRLKAPQCYRLEAGKLAGNRNGSLRLRTAALKARTRQGQTLTYQGYGVAASASPAWINPPPVASYVQ